MKAVVQSAYGSPDVLELREIDVPVIGEGEVLVRVHAAGIHVGDWHVMTGHPYLLRLVGFGLRAPKVRVRGIDVAGKVESVGKNVTQFRPGDDVFGTCKGAFAGYAAAPEESFVLKPANLTFDQAATVPTSSFAALQALRDLGEIRPGQKVLIVGATGGVGAFAVQIAKSFGAEVTGVCSTSKLDLARSLGADHAIDYTQEDFTSSDRRYDFIVDTGGNRSLSDLRRVLSPCGNLVLVGGEGGNRVLGATVKWIQALLLSPFVRQNLRPLSTNPNKKDLLFVRKLIEAGKVRPTVDKTFSLSEVPDAFRYLESGHAQGKIVITVRDAERRPRQGVEAAGTTLTSISLDARGAAHQRAAPSINQHKQSTAQMTQNSKDACRPHHSRSLPQDFRIRSMPSPMASVRHLLIRIAVAVAWASASISYAQGLHMGLTRLSQPDGGQMTVFYSTDAPEAPVRQGPFTLSLASDANPVRGNGRLVVISHGSGGSPWVHTDLARLLVQRGFVVAVPLHSGDNYLDHSAPGPASWIKRPAEVSRAIDAVADHSQLASLLSLDGVGVFGGSAGGHTALSLAGGKWSFSRFRDYCEQNIERDFSSCVGFTTLLRGDWVDGVKLWLARRIIAWRFSDEKVQEYADPRVKAVVAMVPFAADFSPESLAEPRVALGLVIAAKDVNQIPAFHVDAIRARCEPRCEVILRLPEAGHGAMLSPMPPLAPGSIDSYLLSDPPLFDRKAEIPVLHGLISDFFVRHLSVNT